MGQLVSILKQTPLSIRLKATARAITLLKKKNSDSNDHKISWFNNCIRPALAVPHAVNYQEFCQRLNCNYQSISPLFNNLRYENASSSVRVFGVLNSQMALIVAI